MKLRKLNIKGIAHWIVPALVVVAVGVVGAVVFEASHADAVVPILSCSASLNKTTISSGDAIRVIEKFTNTGGGSTAKSIAIVGLKSENLVYIKNSVSGVFEARATVPALTHGQTYTFSGKLGPFYTNSSGNVQLYASYNDGSNVCNNSPLTFDMKK